MKKKQRYHFYWHWNFRFWEKGKKYLRDAGVLIPAGIVPKDMYRTTDEDWYSSPQWNINRSEDSKCWHVLTPLFSCGVASEQLN